MTTTNCKTINKFKAECKIIYVLYQSRKYQECLDKIEACYKENPHKAPLNILSSVCKAVLGTSIEEAHKTLNEILLKEPLNAYAFYAKGLVFYYDGNMRKSMRNFTKAYDIDPDNMEKALEIKAKASEFLDVFNKAQYQINNKLREEALETFNRGLHIDLENKVLIARLEKMRNLLNVEQTNERDDTLTTACDYCQKDFYKNDKLLKHNRFHDYRNRKYHCNTCTYCFTSIKNLNSHVQHKHTSSIVCRICKATFTDIRYLEVHENNFKSRPNYHLILAKSIAAKKKLKKHQASESTSIKFQSQNAQLLQRIPKKFKCRFCSKAFNWEPNMYGHMRTAHKEHYVHICGYCGKSFMRTETLKRHVKSAHAE